MLRYVICADAYYGHSFVVMTHREGSVAAFENGSLLNGVSGGAVG
jgi:aminoglycoside phosphotransferase (APT) family kinase protein